MSSLLDNSKFFNLMWSCLLDMEGKGGLLLRVPCLTTLCESFRSIYLWKKCLPCFL